MVLSVVIAFSLEGNLELQVTRAARLSGCPLPPGNGGTSTNWRSLGPPDVSESGAPATA
jgi:hypothetical protein